MEQERRTDGHCPRCYAPREGRVNLRTGEYIVGIPTRCQTKDECEAELLKALNVANPVRA